MDEEKEANERAPEPDGSTEPEAAPEESAAEAPFAGDGQGSRRGLWRLSQGARPHTASAQRRALQAEQEAPPHFEVDTDVAVPTPPPQAIVHRRTLILGGFWGGIAALTAAIAGGLGLDFLWPRKVKGFGAPVDVAAGDVPPAGSDPVRVAEGRFWLMHLAEGEGGSSGGLLALYQKCPHLGCTVPWRGDFEFAGRKGWFRCPCHASTFTRGGGVLVSGPSPRSMDTMAIEVKPTGDIVVQSGQIQKGGGDNALRAVPYSGAVGQESPEATETPTPTTEET
jgi:cytochrome b6-f complex iron-sulfur subunit